MKETVIQKLKRSPFYHLYLAFVRYIYVIFFRRKKGLSVGSKLKLVGIPMVDIRGNASVTIEDNVTLNSSNREYHVNMHSPVKLYADKDDAKIHIGQNTRIHGTCLHAYKHIKIGDNCLIAANTQIFDGNGHDLSFDNTANRINTEGDAGPIIIEDDVWIGINCIILGGVTIGKGSVVGAGSIVTKSIPPFVVAAGNPAKVIKDIKCIKESSKESI
ncbi:MAG: acyltransferase [Planctomycetota bacterium]|jgi:acetyltransferase-like isoleucine patch superfamily enzyme